MVRPLYGRYTAAAAFALAAMLQGTATHGATPDIVLLDFWSPTCGPCMQMKPTVESLINARYPIRQVNTSQEAELTRQYGVTGIPCFVMLVDGREVDRVVGATSSERLQQMFTTAKETIATQRRMRGQDPGAPLAPRAPVEQGGLTGGGDVPARSGNANAPTPNQVANPANDPPLPQQLNDKLLSSSVRLTVEEAKARSHGTGTIIDARKGEALIVTCGHLFRESKGQVPVNVELYKSTSQGVRVVETLPGQVVSYDLERDVAFVSIRPIHPVCVATVAPQRTPIAKGDLAASVGCSNGQDPTVISTRITWLDRYQGPPNIEASGAPVEGRSGGGLFNDQGQLVGVCFAADYEGNRGLYAGLESIHDELNRLGLQEIYAKPAANAMANNAANGFAPIATAPIVRGQEPRATDPPSPDNGAILPMGDPGPAPNTLAAPAVQNLNAKENAALEEILGRATKRKVIVIIQPETPDGESEVFTINDVSEQFVQELAKQQRATTTR